MCGSQRFTRDPNHEQGGPDLTSQFVEVGATAHLH
jgi:hypothetical protein